ncbi:hypothetical protein M8J76_001261 [Diaphorina citri]|nr:hypothetical protein M8J76_001261 [Diaphorina citri]KAI5732196.1 hypothetical protein M8J77_023111 [Diaphorina citri]
MQKEQNSKDVQQYVGPYKLDKTLGKGQTGLVKVGIHCITEKKVAIKIINREKLSESVLMKVEREIAIMKLIEHPHVLRLSDVYENKKNLYLILEHVSGGELFDYLVKKGRLTPKEARKFFRQIISALDFCHSHSICHRDLKPENLLLDEKTNIKIADFGMASLQPNGSMLETSCGSPHYACPEVIRGEKYDGRRADVWSCGVILYALLVGALPFDDDNLRQLLEKVKRGVFHIPHFVPPDCQCLLRGMIEVNPEKRMTLADINSHPWVTAGGRGELELELPMMEVIQTHIIPSVEEIDPDVLQAISNLGCFKQKDLLIQELLNNQHNTEKVIYFLLLERKRKRPAYEDEAEHFVPRTDCIDPPRKRIDTCKLPPNCSLEFSKIADGSPIISRRKSMQSRVHRRGSITSGKHPGSSASTPNSFISSSSSLAGLLSPLPQRATISNNFTHSSSSLIQTSTNPSAKSDPSNFSLQHVTPSLPEPTPIIWPKSASQQQNLKQRSSQTQLQQSQQKITSPQTHTEKYPINSVHPKYETNNSNTSGAEYETVNPMLTLSNGGGYSYSPQTSPEMSKKYWFGQLVVTDKEETITLLVKGKSLAAIKADLIHAFLTVADLCHNVINPMSFKVEYQRNNARTLLFQSQVKFQVDITSVKTSNPDEDCFSITFSLAAGNIRRFKRICDHIQAHICDNHAPSIPTSPKVCRKFSSDLSESSSCSSDTAEPSEQPMPSNLYSNNIQIQCR